MTDMDVHFSSEDMTWETPQEIFDFLDERWNFTLDPCCSKQSAKCENYFTEEDDGLIQDWGTNTVFMNPPYGRAIRDFMAKAVDAADKGASVVCLVPARVDTIWWYNSVAKTGADVTFVKGRLKFGNGEYRAENSAPFPSAIIYLNENTTGQHEYVERKDLEKFYE